MEGHHDMLNKLIICYVGRKAIACILWTKVLDA